jgi:putative transposase
LPYWQLFYHFVWATFEREAFISPELEPRVYGLLRGKATALGATVYAVNGMPDHVHLVAAVPPNVSLASFVGQIKGACSTRINKEGARFKWQDEYAAFSFDAKRLPPIVDYVDHQKLYHAGSGLIPALERLEGPAPTRHLSKPSLKPPSGGAAT